MLGEHWTKATASMSNGQCVEARRRGGRVEIRDSEDPDGPVLAVPEESWEEVLTALARLTWPRPDRRVRGLIDPGLGTGRPPADRSGRRLHRD